MRLFALFASALLCLFLSCGERKTSETTAPTAEINVPPFNADSAYAHIKRQVDFGPRVPNTSAHSNTAAFLVSTLKNQGAAVTVQQFEAASFDGIKLNLKNIIASFHPDQPKRILLAAHWDTRPFADKDKTKRDAPMDGANDGASGVGVILEIARVIAKNPPPHAGVDIIFFDGEDWGEKDYEGRQIPPPENWEEWWCLGSQYWAKHKHKPNYSAYYGILLDMVGAKGSRFYRENVSLEFAPRIVEKVWSTAERIGYSDYFVKQNAGAALDDHVFVNRNARIPMIDIIPHHPSQGFGDFHHTTSDNMALIDKNTLKAVGTTVLHVIYSEN
jgi:glutaminyl-peptide cyclotransferase